MARVTFICLDDLKVADFQQFLDPSLVITHQLIALTEEDNIIIINDLNVIAILACIGVCCVYIYI